MQHDDMSDNNDYRPGSITLGGAVAMGTGVMIGAGIFALTGQIAQLAGALFPLAFVAGAVVTGFSAYSYIRMSNAWPSAGGIAMILQKCYGPGAIAAGAALLMALSMVIAESLVARTFATYVLRPFDITGGPLVPILALSVIIFAFLVNIAGNRSVGMFSMVMAVVKIGGIALFGIAALWASGFQFAAASEGGQAIDGTGFVASVALAILAFKGFTTITNSGSEVIDPKRNVGRAIIISIAACVVIYTLVGFAVASNLSLAEIIKTQDYSLAAAARPALGDYGVWFTVAIAMMATAGGILASIFAVSRMLAMLTEMKLVPHSHFGMPGSIQKHTLVYTVVLGLILTAFFDLSRIAALGIIFYLIMDIAIHWGVLRYLREDVKANVWVPTVAIVLDLLALGGFVWVKLNTDLFVIGVAVVTMIVIAVAEQLFLKKATEAEEAGHKESHAHHH